MNSETVRDIPSSVVSALSQGNKIEAIKLLREAYGIGLKEAKDMVDEYVKSRPEMSMKLVNLQQETKRSFFIWIVILAIALLVCYWWFMRK
jgi:ribosomal protein L7/L12